MVVIVRALIELDPVYSTVESTGLRGIILGYRRAALVADVARFIGGEDHRLCRCNAATTNRFSIQEEGDISSFAESTAVIGKFHPYLVFARGKRRNGFGVESLESIQVVTVLESAVFGVQGPAAKFTALRYDDTVWIAVWKNHFGSHRMGFVLQVEHGVLTEPAHAAEEQLRAALNERGPSGEV